MLKKLSIDQVNYLNVGLMIVSMIAALIRPFETFLFVYAFLGPLHYLTEISWLHDRQYFTKRKYDFLLLLAAGILITLLSLRVIKFENPSMGTALTFFAFGSALIFVVIKNLYARAAAFLVLFILVANVSKAQWAEYTFGIFLPTLIHVFIFTGLFILVGALRGRSLSGILSLGVFIICAISFFYVSPEHKNYQISDYVRNSYGFLTPQGFSDGFFSLNYYVMDIFNIHHFEARQAKTAEEFVAGVNNFIYHNPAALAVMSFIAFAYMYHYLNWFSKTSIIQWHNIPRSRFMGVIALWLASIGLYAYNYALGLDWLFFLSFTHVLFEFPLNHLTFINIGKEIGGMIKGGTPAPVKAAKAKIPTPAHRG